MELLSRMILIAGLFLFAGCLGLTPTGFQQTFPDGSVGTCIPDADTVTLLHCKRDDGKGNFQAFDWDTIAMKEMISPKAVPVVKEPEAK